MKKKKHICPVCGFDGLREPAFDEQDNPSYEVCPCCGYEFGFDGRNDPLVFACYRERWLKKGAVWFMKKRMPAGWKKERQLKNLRAVIALVLAFSFLPCAGLAQEQPVDDTAFLNDYIDSLGLAAQLRTCVKYADRRSQPAIDSVEIAQAFFLCYSASERELGLARELVSRHRNNANPRFKELAERTEFLYGAMFEVIRKCSALHEEIHKRWQERISDPKKMNQYYRELIALDNERQQLATLLLTACYRIKDEEKKTAGRDVFTLPAGRRNVFLRRLEGFFGKEVSLPSGPHTNGLAAAGSVFYEELSRQKDVPVQAGKPQEVYLNTEYGIEFPVPHGYRWKQLDERKRQPSGREHISLGIASMDLSGESSGRFGNSFITMSVYEYPHRSPVQNLDMLGYVLATINPAAQKLRSGIAVISISGFPAAYYILEERLSEEGAEVASLILLVRLGPFRILELVGTTLPKDYFDAYRLQFEEAFLGLKLAR